MKHRKSLSILFFLFLASLITFPTSGGAVHKGRRPASEDLSISPVYQETPVWCWVAVGQMVFEHYDIPNVNPAGDYQCGIIGALAGPASPCWNNCRICTVPAGYMQNIRLMLGRYTQVIRAYVDPSARQLDGTYTPSALTASQVKAEIDNNRPIIAGINPSGFAPAPGQSMHVCLIVGYDEDEEGDLTLTVNDPFPYDIVNPQLRNPFAAAGGDSSGDGSYTILYSRFRRNLVWNSSIYRIE